MEKRVEKIVECITESTYLTKGREYLVHLESEEGYSVKDDEGDVGCWDKEDFKEVSEREVLEFEGFNLDKCGQNGFNLEYSLEITSEIDLTNCDLKVIATPKEEEIEYWKNNAEENYMTTPISVLRYITELEKKLKSKE